MSEQLAPELANAPEPEPVARVTGYYAGYLSIATVDGRVLPAGTALYAALPHQSEHILEMVNTPAPSVPELEEYDAGALNDFGGGNVGWWQDYIRSELGRAYEFYCGQLSAAPTPAPSVPDGWRAVPLSATVEMRNAGRAHLTGITSYSDSKALQVYGAMLAAAPTPAEAPADVAKAVAAEREACAKACEQRKIITPEWQLDQHYNQGASHCAAAIRARGEKDQA